MEKRGKLALALSVLLNLVLVGTLFFYFALYTPPEAYVQPPESIANPIEGLTVDQAIGQLNESFIYYFLYSVKAYELHNPPLSNDTPKLQFVIGAAHYYSVIENGNIRVEKGDIVGKDIKVITSPREAVLMLKNRNHIQESFQSGDSTFELLADKTTLFSKGYLKLYQELTGKTLTGSVVRISSS
ncbi:hypothetical protein KW805_01660 [Candidatus Pacearchaeota archaeon]|nr:hypothetical protein [Candidatus Pacearchaeota archaeon]